MTCHDVVGHAYTALHRSLPPSLSHNHIIALPLQMRSTSRRITIQRERTIMEGGLKRSPSPWKRRGVMRVGVGGIVGSTHGHQGERPPSKPLPFSFWIRAGWSPRSAAMCLISVLYRRYPSSVSSGIFWQIGVLPRVSSVTLWPSSTSWRARYTPMKRVPPVPPPRTPSDCGVSHPTALHQPHSRNAVYSLHLMRNHCQAEV